MAVEKLDLKQIWESGQTWVQWLDSSKEAAKKQEMERIFNEAAVPDYIVKALKALDRNVHVLALAEDWCGDVRRNVPVMAKLSAQNPDKLQLRLVDKETKPQLMVRYLTNAAEAIPIVVFFNDTFVEIGNWGPRPNECKRFMARGKACNNIEAARKQISEFYAKDQSQSAIKELYALIDIAAAKTV